MRKIFGWLSLALLCVGAHAQVRQDTLTLVAPAPAPVNQVSTNVTGPRGGINYFYWVVANYPGGSAQPAGVLEPNAPFALSGSNFVTVQWSTAAGATSYDVLRTFSETFPGGPCACAVATGITGNSATDTGGGPSAYLFVGKPPAIGTIRIDNSGAAPAFVSNPPLGGGSTAPPGTGCAAAAAGTFTATRVFGVDTTMQIDNADCSAAPVFHVRTDTIQSRATTQAGTSTFCSSTTGNTTYACGMTPVTSGAYTAPACLVLIADTSNTTSAMLNVDTRGALPILSGPAGTALSASAVTAGVPATLCLKADASAWIIQGAGGSTCTIAGNAVTPPVSGNWTALGTGGARNNITSPCGGGTAIELIGTVGSSNLYGVQMAASGNFTHTLIVDAAIPQVQFSNLNIGFTDETISEGCGPAYNGAFILTGNLIPTLASGGGPANGLQSDFSPSSPNFPYLPALPLIVQLNKTGSVLTCSISLNHGASFKTVFVDSTPALTPTAIFVGMTPSSGTPTIHIQATIISVN